VLREASESAQCESDEPFLVRRRALSGLKDLFFRLAERRRVVVTIEDLQWADTDTLQILSEILTPPEKPNLFVLLTARTEAELIQTLATGLRKVTTVELLELGSLNAEASRILASNLLPTALRVEAITQRIVEESHGIPEQIVAFAQELSIAPKGREPALLSDALMARIERLEPKSRDLLELIAVAVRPITVPIAAGCGLSGVQDSIRDLMQQHVVRSASLINGERGFDIYNEHVRKVALHAIPEERLTSYHKRLIGVLENSSKVEPEWLLAHYRGAGAYDRAKEYSIIIAQKALQLLAYDHAASMFLVALELTSEHSVDWSSLNISCAEALTKAGRGVEAASAYVRAARGLSRDEQLPLLSLAVEQWIRSGHVDRGVELLRQTLKWVGIEWPETTASALLQLVSRRIAIRLRGLSCEPRLETEAPVELLRKLDAIRPAQTVLGTYDYIRGATFAAMALPLALKAREPRRLLIALASEAIFAAMLEGVNGAGRVKDVLEKVNGLYQYAERPIERAIPTFVKAITSYWMGNWSHVREHASHAETILRERVEGTLWEASLARSVRHTVMLHNGNVVGLTDELPDALSQATMYDDRYTQLDLQRRVATIHLLNDEVRQAKKVVETICEERNRSGIIAMDHLIMSLVVAVRLYEGDVAGARFELEKRWAECTKIGMHRFPQVRLSVVGMFADCISANTTMTVSVRRDEFLKLEKLARSVPVTWSQALSAMLAAEAFECEGKTQKSIVEFRHASEGFSECGFGVCSAVANKRAEHLQRINQPTERDALSAVRNPERWMRIARTLY
jgi:tetratricopeptide (TPR) repeat protein